MNQPDVINEQKTLQDRSVELRGKIEVADGALAWFAMQPAGSEADARRLKDEYAAELQQIEARRSALLQQILSAPFGGE